MSHCYSVGVEINGQETEICTSHVPGNEHIKKALDKGQSYDLTKEDVKRAVDYYFKNEHKMKNPQIEAPDLGTMKEMDHAEHE